MRWSLRSLPGLTCDISVNVCVLGVGEDCMVCLNLLAGYCVPRFPLFPASCCRGQAPGGESSPSEKAVDRSPQVLPSPFAAQGMTDGLVERRCSGHMNHNWDLQQTKGSLNPQSGHSHSSVLGAG